MLSGVVDHAEPGQHARQHDDEVLDRREPQLRPGLRPDEPGGAGQPRDGRRFLRRDGRPNFGKVVPGATFDPDALRGWGQRNYNWEFSAGVQQKTCGWRARPDVSYFRRWYGNFTVTDNLMTAPSDYDLFSFTAPSDPRLPRRRRLRHRRAVRPQPGQIRPAGAEFRHAFR